MATNGGLEFLKEQIDQEIKLADRRRHKHKRASVAIWLFGSVFTRAIPVLLGLRLPQLPHEQAANVTMVLGALASVLSA